jgi:hypothetical protein
MTVNLIDESQRKAAKVVGFIYLFALVPAIFAEFYVSGQLINYDNAAETARNIMANERLFRLGIASNLVVWVVDVVLITALYVVLKPVNRSLALLATFWRLIETAVLVIVPLTDQDVLRVLSGAEYLRAIGPEQLQAMARLSIGAHNAVYNVGLMFLGLGSTVFCYLWFKSGYIPKALAALGVLGSLLIGVCTFAFIIFPEARNVIPVAVYTGPIFIFELTIGFWLLFKGIRTSERAIDSQQSPA